MTRPDTVTTILEAARDLGAGLEATRVVEASRAERAAGKRQAEAVAATDAALAALRDKVGQQLSGSQLATLAGEDSRQRIHQRIQRHGQRTTTNGDDTNTG